MQFTLAHTGEFEKLTNQLIAFHQEPNETKDLNEETVQKIPDTLKRMFNTIKVIENTAKHSDDFETKQVAAQAAEIAGFKEQMKLLANRFEDKLEKAKSNQTERH